LAHHFDTPEQQFATGKLGMWAFLATEILMFGGLFAAYAIYRHNHPEVFLASHKALDTTMGFINTLILLASSFTMAWGVRAAQLNQKKLLLVMLALTFLGGVGFLGIKYFEYESKWKHHLFPGTLNVFNPKFAEAAGQERALELKGETLAYIQKPHGGKDAADSHRGGSHGGPDMLVPTVAPQVAVGTMIIDPHADTGDASKVTASIPRTVPAGINLDALTHNAGHRVVTYNQLRKPDQERVNSFFSVYFMMTGLHGIHVVIGMGVIAWLFVRAMGGEFGSNYYTPVDLGGLYWHLVDLIWIFLFPLLYLIH
jgi:cytochrome c oxidase subunit 3